MVRYSSIFTLLLAGGLLVSCSKYDLMEIIGTKNEKQNKRTYTVKLSGDNELPNPVDTKARGQAVFKVSKNGEEIRFKITVSRLENYLAGHIHIAPPTENGPVVTWLFPTEPYPFPNFVDDPLLPGTTNGVLAEGVITEEDLSGPLAGMSLQALISEMETGNAYVNLHTSQYVSGEIRGNF